jgi:hypothetical protein
MFVKNITRDKFKSLPIGSIVYYKEFDSYDEKFNEKGLVEIVRAGEQPKVKVVWSMFDNSEYVIDVQMREMANSNIEVFEGDKSFIEMIFRHNL